MFVKTRSQLTAVDCAFIASTLGMSENERAYVMNSGSDPEILTPYLRDERLLHRSMTPPPVFLEISPHLFFYMLVYRALDRKRLADDDVVDYIADVCFEFRTSGSLWHLAATGEGTFFYMADLLNLMADLDGVQRHLLRKHIGNITLFLTGFFPGHFEVRTARRGAPPIGFYEGIARTQYGDAAEDPLAESECTSGVLHLLAENFPEVRTALNDLSEEYRLVGREGAPPPPSDPGQPGLE